MRYMGVQWLVLLDPESLSHGKERLMRDTHTYLK